MRLMNRACSVAFELTFVLFFVLLVLAPFQGLATRHLTVIQSFDSTHAAIGGDVSGLKPGDTVTLYRFNHDWKAPIGEATVELVSPVTARIAVVPSEMRWPLGRHGIVTQVASSALSYVSLGANHGIAEGDALNLYRDRQNVGQARVVTVEAARSRIEMPINIGEINGLTASEFTFATQAVVYNAPLQSAIQSAVIVLALLIYAVVYLRAKRSPFFVLGEKIRTLKFSPTLAFWLVNILAGIPFVWFMAKMPLYLFAYLGGYVSMHVFSQYVYLFPAMDLLLPYAYALLALIYFVYLGLYAKSPILALWRAISYPTRSLGTAKAERKEKKQTLARGLFLWALHLVIVYAFAWTLLGFLRGDVQAALSIGFPAPTREALFEQMKFIIWALTVVGVLIGYGYSVLSILWGKFIRNLDFTVTGWLTNGFCYPFLGVVIWQMIPGFTGVDPIITAGPLQTLMLWLGLILNLLYMLSIFNLGILFDLMTDKGVRFGGFYSVIRHPNYTLEVSMFLVTELVGLTMGIQWLAIMMYFFVYWVRSEREDNFMEYSNPDYTVYQKQTPFKFLPGIY